MEKVNSEGIRVFYEDVMIDNLPITLSAGENTTLKVWVNDRGTFDLPLVHNDELTICLTVAGLAALEQEECFRFEDIETVEFEDQSLYEDLCGHCEGCSNNEEEEL